VGGEEGKKKRERKKWTYERNYCLYLPNISILENTLSGKNSKSKGGGKKGERVKKKKEVFELLLRSFSFSYDSSSQRSGDYAVDRREKKEGERGRETVSLSVQARIHFHAQVMVVREWGK